MSARVVEVFSFFADALYTNSEIELASSDITGDINSSFISTQLSFSSIEVLSPAPLTSTTNTTVTARSTDYQERVLPFSSIPTAPYQEETLNSTIDSSGGIITVTAFSNTIPSAQIISLGETIGSLQVFDFITFTATTNTTVTARSIDYQERVLAFSGITTSSLRPERVQPGWNISGGLISFPALLGGAAAAEAAPETSKQVWYTS